MCFIISIIIRISEIHKHEIGNKSLQSKFIEYNYCFRIGNSRKKPISLGEATIINSISEVQGYFLCYRKIKCKTNSVFAYWYL